MAGAADAAAGGGSVAKDTGDDFEFCVLSSAGARAPSGSSSGCVSRSESSKSASSDHSAAHPPPQQQQQPRRSLSSSLFYAHPSPSPQLRTRPPRRSTGSAPPPPPATAWGIFRLGVVGAPDVYPPRSTDSKNAAAAAKVGSSRSARFEPASTAADKKHPVVGLFGDSFGCKCSPDVVEPVTLPAAAKRAKAKNKNKAGDKKAQSVRRSRILDWFEELTITKK
ncbi:hypothetical protein OsJ_24949 [Oryza sativa Japonica Group]|uniref:Uncharacterized protein n=1 Tax=Oryza sativa subsp. japonica TaxID=39947 RepID=B9FY70_ORYSJ|nr:hypothetical protein OsJ_24949 [Oryza sativa Japonica Group]